MQIAVKIAVYRGETNLDLLRDYLAKGYKVINSTPVLHLFGGTHTSEIIYILEKEN